MNILGAIPADRRKDYSALITALETRFGCSVQKQLNRVRLRNRRQKRGEVADDVERLVMRVTYANTVILGIYVHQTNNRQERSEEPAPDNTCLSPLRFRRTGKIPWQAQLTRQNYSLS